MQATREELISDITDLLLNNVGDVNESISTLTKDLTPKQKTEVINRARRIATEVRRLQTVIAQHDSV